MELFPFDIKKKKESSIKNIFPMPNLEAKGIARILYAWLRHTSRGQHEGLIVIKYTVLVLRYLTFH